jgi:hypothetical protein
VQELREALHAANETILSMRKTLLQKTAQVQQLQYLSQPAAIRYCVSSKLGTMPVAKEQQLQYLSQPAATKEPARCSVYLFYEYNGTDTDAEGSEPGSRSKIWPRTSQSSRAWPNFISRTLVLYYNSTTNLRFCSMLVSLIRPCSLQTRKTDTLMCFRQS